MNPAVAAPGPIGRISTPLKPAPMPFHVIVERSPLFIRFNASGSASLQNYFDLVDFAARETLATGDKKGLVDLRQVSGRLGFTDQFFIGEVVGRKLTHMDKVASLVPADPRSYNSETVAKKLGLNLRSFDREELAIAWLLDMPADGKS